MCDISSDNDSTDETLSEIRDRDASVNTSNYLLPEKSKNKYDKVYQDFMRWKTSKFIQSFNEEVLVEYFQILSEKFKSSSLYTFYSMLKCTLSLNNEVDISKYSKLLAWLKANSEGYQGKKSKTFSPEEIVKFLTEAHDRDYLLTKIALIFGIVGACRRQELYQLKFKDVEVYGSTIFVRVQNPTTNHPRTFTITGSYFELCKKYIGLRPDPCSNEYFFLHYKSGKCLPRNVGINSLGKLGKTIASYLELPNPELYTGHCFRRTSSTVSVDADGDILPLKRHCKWKYPDESSLNDIVESEIQVPLLIPDSSENNSNQVMNINFPSTTAAEDCTNNPHQILKAFENKNIECVNINIPSKEAEVYMNDPMDTKDQVWNDIQNCFQNKRDKTANIPGSTLTDGYTSDSMDNKSQVWHHVQNSVIGKSSEYVNINIPSSSVSEGFIDDSTKNNDPVGNQIGNSLEKGSNKVVNINIPSTSNLQQSVSALVRFSNCNIQNVNINYTK